MCTYTLASVLHVFAGMCIAIAGYVPTISRQKECQQWAVGKGRMRRWREIVQLLDYDFAIRLHTHECIEPNIVQCVSGDTLQRNRTHT